MKESRKIPQDFLLVPVATSGEVLPLTRGLASCESMMTFGPTFDFLKVWLVRKGDKDLLLS